MQDLQRGTLQELEQSCALRRISRRRPWYRGLWGSLRLHPLLGTGQKSDVDLKMVLFSLVYSYITKLTGASDHS